MRYSHINERLAKNSNNFVKYANQILDAFTQLLLKRFDYVIYTQYECII